MSMTTRRTIPGRNDLQQLQQRRQRQRPNRSSRLVVLFKNSVLIVLSAWMVLTMMPSVCCFVIIADISNPLAMDISHRSSRHPQQSPQRSDSSSSSLTSSIGSSSRTTMTRLLAGRTTSTSDRKPSKVSDPDGPTPDYEQSVVDEIDPDAIEELRDIASGEEMPEPPIAHQPWRRGDTAGCHDPISAQWRKDAEKIMEQSAMLVGATVLDVTWYLTQVVITIDDDKDRLPENDMLKSTGPVINIIPKSSPVYYDPNDSNPDDIWENDNVDGEILYQHETPEEAEASKQRKNMMYATKDEEDPVDEPHIPDQEGDESAGKEAVSLFMNDETRADVALKVADDELERYEEQEKPIDLDTIRIDTSVISSIAHSILTALEDYEDDLQILSRHEVILTSPGPPDLLESQKQFDAHIGQNIIVETQDPFNSNRVLKGQLASRDAMDLILNQKGRMVTIPLNFVKCVRVVSLPGEESDESLVTP